MPLRRISIQADDGGAQRTHDVAVCACTPVAGLLPTVLDTIGLPADVDGRWRLSTATGDPLDESKSLVENDVCDGDVVVLGSEHDPVAGLLAVEPMRAIADAGGISRIHGTRLLEFGWAMVMFAVAIVLLRTGTAGCAAAAAWCAVATAWRAVTVTSALLAVTAALVAGAAGFAAVPSGPAAPNVLLGAAVAFAATIALNRLTPGATTALTAAGSAAVLIAAVAAVSTVWDVRAGAAGAILTCIGFGLLAAAPRLAALLSRVQPSHLAAPPDDFVLRADSAHTVLTGLVIGSAIAAATGVVLVSSSAAPVNAGIAFVVVTALVLSARIRTHVDAPRRIALAAAAVASTAVAFVTAASEFPDRIGWMAVGITAVLGLAALGPRARRAVDAVDYACAALLVPLACWVIGLYAVARNWVVA